MIVVIMIIGRMWREPLVNGWTPEGQRPDEGQREVRLRSCNTQNTMMTI